MAPKVPHGKKPPGKGQSEGVEVSGLPSVTAVINSPIDVTFNGTGFTPGNYILVTIVGRAPSVEVASVPDDGNFVAVWHNEYAPLESTTEWYAAVTDGGGNAIPLAGDSLGRVFF